ncbi:MAG: peptide chain release factor N(5)-glutamine methyltransferase [Mariniblastus sp.]
MPDTPEQTWTIKQLLDWTSDFFSKSTIGNARLEAEVLLAEALDCQRIQLYTRFDEQPPAQQLTEFRDWVKRRAAGEPVAYLAGHREFYSLRFHVDSNVLIPRPETEHLVVAAVEFAKNLNSDPIRIIDVGTGSGCIAVTLATLIENCKIAATDISEPALEIAKSNAAHHAVESKMHFFAGDLLDALPPGSSPVHLIVSNPPYIGKLEISTVDDQVKNHEPDIALFSGDHGTEIIQRLVNDAAQFLLPQGALMFETSPIIMDRCVDLVRNNQAYSEVRVIKDYSGHDRIVVATRTDQ